VKEIIIFFIFSCNYRFKQIEILQYSCNEKNCGKAPLISGIDVQREKTWRKKLNVGFDSSGSDGKKLEEK